MTTSAPSSAPISVPRIGVFDSGLGGLSVLRSIRQQLPAAQLLYVADSGHAPYGERGDDYVCARSLAIAEFLYQQGAQLLVIACNTATAAAATALRARYPDGRIVGVEPGVKPAAALSRNGRVGVMATNGTLRSERFRLLAQAHAAHLDLRLQACTGLAAAIEAGEIDAPAVHERVETHCAALRAQDVDTVVLGCTHYPFVAHHIQAAMGDTVRLIDTSDAVARRTVSLIGAPGAGYLEGQTAATPVARLWTTGDVATLRGFVDRWLDFPCTFEALAQ